MPASAQMAAMEAPAPSLVKIVWADSCIVLCPSSLIVLAAGMNPAANSEKPLKRLNA
jgi:hypothetical protein